MPASISGKFHIGETSMQHLENTATIMKHLCDEFKINKEDRDMLIGAAYLHDVGLALITRKGKIEEPGWKYYKETGYSRLTLFARIHPYLSACVIEEYHIPRKEELKRLVSIHMSHWYQMTPRPKGRYEDLLCIADYLASRDVRKYEEKNT
jgi:hypothetical protein